MDTLELIQELVNRTLKEGGITFDFKNNRFAEPKDHWYFPKHPDLTVIVSKEKLAESLARFISDRRILLLKGDVVFGTWVNPLTDKVYLDINTFRDDESEALKSAKWLSASKGREIVSIYNPVKDKTVYIDH
jgi:hypothetical protein